MQTVVARDLEQVRQVGDGHGAGDRAGLVVGPAQRPVVVTVGPGWR